MSVVWIYVNDFKENDENPTATCNDLYCYYFTEWKRESHCDKTP